MQPDAKDHVSASDLEDLRYLSDLAARESDRVFANLQPCLDESVPAAAASAMQQLAISVGELAARVQILESALELRLAEPDPFSSGPLLYGAHQIQVEELVQELECHAPEVGESGRTRLWTRGAAMQFHLYANRSRPKFVRLWFEAIIKPEYARKLELQVDGYRQKHAVLSRAGQYAIEWKLDENEDLGPTKIDISLPDVHSPAGLGASEDHRQLGIAITGLEFDGVRRQSLISRILRR